MYIQILMKKNFGVISIIIIIIIINEKGFFQISVPEYKSIITAYTELQGNQKINNKEVDSIFGEGNACEVISNFFNNLN